MTHLGVLTTNFLQSCLAINEFPKSTHVNLISKKDAVSFDLSNFLETLKNVQMFPK